MQPGDDTLVIRQDDGMDDEDREMEERRNRN